MTKNGIRGYITLAIIFVVYSVIAFVVPFDMTTLFWIAYIFGTIAIVYQIYVFKNSFAKGNDTKSKFYGYPIAKIGVLYLIVQLGLSFVEMILANILSIRIAIIINIIVFAVAVLGCIATDTVRDEIVRQEFQLKKDVSNIRVLQSLSSSLIGQCSDYTLKTDLQKLADEFKYSDPVSSDYTKEIENVLSIQMEELQNSIIVGDYENSKALCAKLVNGLAERNRICVLNK